jgi:hypothetical protein
MEVTSDLRVTIRDVRAARLCCHGGRDWCAAYGIAWADVLGDGVPVEFLLSLKDPFAERVVAARLARAK